MLKQLTENITKAISIADTMVERKHKNQKNYIILAFALLIFFSYPLSFLLVDLLYKML